jgi:predicted nucleic acid-binding protein
VRFALDSNFLIYAESLADDPRDLIAQRILQDFSSVRFVMPAQSIADTTNWLVRKAKQMRQFAPKSTLRWAENYAVQATDKSILASALNIMVIYELQAFDAIILASAAEASAAFLLTEDMQDGLT